ncbi:hypothetical protein V8F33_012623 [Rhypophila sp. PSN 637]
MAAAKAPSRSWWRAALEIVSCLGLRARADIEGSWNIRRYIRTGKRGAPTIHLGVTAGDQENRQPENGTGCLKIRVIDGPRICIGQQFAHTNGQQPTSEHVSRQEHHLIDTEMGTNEPESGSWLSRALKAWLPLDWQHRTIQLHRPISQATEAFKRLEAFSQDQNIQHTDIQDPMERAWRENHYEQFTRLSTGSREHEALRALRFYLQWRQGRRGTVTRYVNSADLEHVCRKVYSTLIRYTDRGEKGLRRTSRQAYQAEREPLLNSAAR